MTIDPSSYHQNTLFDENTKSAQNNAPLADRMRPKTLSEFVGQNHLLAPGKPFKQLIEKGKIPSMILWGPPGIGKTTLAFIISKMHNMLFVPYSAVLGSIKEIKQLMHKYSNINRTHARKLLLLIDEVHRLNKAQQDAFLPYIEKGAIAFIGATTENPSFEVIPALLSRTKVYTLTPLTPDDIKCIIIRALSNEEQGYGKTGFTIAENALHFMVILSDGDARKALNILELAVEYILSSQKEIKEISLDFLKELEQKKIILFDKQGEEFYNLISALHKSIRNSDIDASIYWLTRMIEGGADLLYLARRLIRVASEDIGNADPRALSLAIAAKEAVHFLGNPEGILALVQTAIYLAAAPKSNAVYTAYGKALEAVKNTVNEPVPLHLRNPVTSLMKHLGYGKDYLYAHDFDEKTTSMDCLPDSLKSLKLYLPAGKGFEKIIVRRLKRLSSIKRK